MQVKLFNGVSKPPVPQVRDWPDRRGVLIALPTSHDLRILVALPFLAAIAWCLPPAWWSRFGRLRKIAIPPRDVSPTGAKHSGPSPKWDDWGGLLPYLREFRPGGWHPEIRAENIERIGKARDEGRGVLLWVADFRYSSLVVKKSLFAAGFGVHHLSRPGHGPSQSAFGMRHLNWIMQAIEERYLAERLVLAAGHEVSVLRRMHEVLASGGICSIAANAEGRQTARIPFKGGLYSLATGSPMLALATGAVLMPVFCVPSSPDRDGFRVIVDAPIDLSREVSRKTAVQTAMVEYVERHRPYVEEHGNLWGGFRHLETP